MLKTPGATPNSNPRSFSARVGRLALSNDGRSKNVPCIDEAKEGAKIQRHKAMAQRTQPKQKKQGGFRLYLYRGEINLIYPII